MNELPVVGWKNKSATNAIKRLPGEGRQYWLEYYKGTPWPAQCSEYYCDNVAIEGAHIYNEEISGEWIAPMCHLHNATTETFTLKHEIRLAPLHNV